MDFCDGDSAEEIKNCLNGVSINKSLCLFHFIKLSEKEKHCFSVKICPFSDCLLATLTIILLITTDDYSFGLNRAPGKILDSSKCLYSNGFK